jgi:hypothetical protein
MNYVTRLVVYYDYQIDECIFVFEKGKDSDIFTEAQWERINHSEIQVIKITDFNEYMEDGSHGYEPEDDILFEILKQIHNIELPRECICKNNVFRDGVTKFVACFVDPYVRVKHLNNLIC